MKKTLRYQANGKTVEREINYIPVRYIFAVLFTVLEVTAIIGIVLALCCYVPYFYLAAWATEIFCVVRIISSDDNPDYKVPWLVFVLILPVAGFMLYFIFYSRKLQPKFVRRLKALKDMGYRKDDSDLLAQLAEEDISTASTARMLCQIADTHLFFGTKTAYYSSGKDMWRDMLIDLQNARSFIYLEFFIIEEGVFWNSVLEILKQKAADGLDVRVMYDDIGCMRTLPGNYAKILGSFGIRATPFSRLRGNADSEFNNRNHRKILIIDGKVGYTGGVNLADEYVGEAERFGHWKDVGLRLEGEAVYELTHLFLVDYGISVKKLPESTAQHYPPLSSDNLDGFVIPFGDGPRPIYTRRVAKTLIMRMLSSATRYAYITTPYLIIDNDMCTALENAAMRGVDVRIVVPHIPDKKLVFIMTRSFYRRLMDAGVRIYEYAPGFIHAKCYLVDDETAMVGTVNLDYRSLVHHFENGVWMYRTACLKDIKADLTETIQKSIAITPAEGKGKLGERFLQALIRVFAPLM